MTNSAFDETTRNRPLHALLALNRLDTLRALSDEDLERLRSQADLVISDCLYGIRAIAQLMYWSNTPEDPPSPDLYITGISDALGLLSEAAVGARGLETMAARILDGAFERKPPEPQPVKSKR